MQAQIQTLKHDTELLNFIYQNARMGITGINQIRSCIKDMNFLNLLNTQYAQYDNFAVQAESALRDLGEKSKDISPAAKAGSFISSKCNTAVDSTVSHLAEMMIEGTCMGITKLQQKVNAMQDCTQQYKDIAQQLIDFENKSIEDLKQFL